MSNATLERSPSAPAHIPHDPAGNMTSKDVITDAETITEVRTYNDLNQIVTNVVDDGDLLGPKTWTFSHDANGNMTGKVMTQEILGVPVVQETWAYVWDEDNRLIRVDKNSVTQVEYEYDAIGRMMTRTEYVSGVAQDPTGFEWDAWDMMRETAADETVTRYNQPNGEVFTFERGTALFHVHSDALGSIRALTDSTGTVASHFELDAWGNQLTSSSDGITGGFDYDFVGTLGVRLDQSSGLRYMSHRWYDPGLGRFLSIDPFRSENPYRYVSNPINYIDPMGLDDYIPPGWTRLPPGWHAKTQDDGVHAYWNNDPADFGPPRKHHRKPHVGMAQRPGAGSVTGGFIPKTSPPAGRVTGGYRPPDSGRVRGTTTPSDWIPPYPGAKRKPPCAPTPEEVFDDCIKRYGFETGMGLSAVAAGLLFSSTATSLQVLRIGTVVISGSTMGAGAAVAGFAMLAYIIATCKKEAGLPF